MDFRRPLSVVALTLDGDVLAVLASADEAFTGRRIHQVLGRGSEEGVRKAADRLVEQGIVTRRQAGRAKLYSFNRSHLAAGPIEQLATLRLELVVRLRSYLEAWGVSPASAFLFGSAARGEAGPESDIDLFLVRPQMSGEDEREWQAQLTELESRATAWTGNQARVVEYSLTELADPEVQKIAQEVLREGVPIFGTASRLRGQLRKSKA
jgi:predicted nucleotidyltransferase